MSPEEVTGAIEKQAKFGGLGKLLGKLAPYATGAALLDLGSRGYNAVKDIATGAAGSKLPEGVVSSLGLLTGVGGLSGLVAGGALGYGKAKFDDEPVDDDAIKAKELEDTYKAYATRLKSQREYQKYLRAKAAL